MWSRVPHLVLAAVLVTSFAACGDDKDGDDPGRGASSPASSTTTAGGEPTGPAGSPTVAPATGPVIRSNAYTMHLFADPGWKIGYVGTTPGAGIDSDYGRVYVSGGGIGATEVPLDTAAANAEELAAKDDPPVERVEDRVVNGVELFVLEGRNDRIRSLRLGGWHAGFQVSLHIEMPLEYPDGDALVESMLASIEWK